MAATLENCFRRSENTGDFDLSRSTEKQPNLTGLFNQVVGGYPDLEEFKFRSGNWSESTVDLTELKELESLRNVEIVINKEKELNRIKGIENLTQINKLAITIMNVTDYVSFSSIRFPTSLRHLEIVASESGYKIVDLGNISELSSLEMLKIGADALNKVPDKTLRGLKEIALSGYYWEKQKEMEELGKRGVKVYCGDFPSTQPTKREKSHWFYDR